MGFLPQGIVIHPAIIFLHSPPPSTTRVIPFLPSFSLTRVLPISLLVKIPRPTITSENRDKVENAGKSLETVLDFFLYKTNAVLHDASHSSLTFLIRKDKHKPSCTQPTSDWVKNF